MQQKQKCPYSIEIDIRKTNGKSLFRFNDSPSNLIVGFAAIQKYMDRFVRDPFRPCIISAVIKDKNRKKVYEIKNQESQLVSCMAPVMAYTEIKLGVGYQPITPRFRSFNK
jgi:hypothetical protein